MRTPSRRKPKEINSHWKGPFEEGISFSSLVKFLECRERFRIYKIEGIRESKTFEDTVSMEYGSIWHEGEQAHAAGKDPIRAMDDYRKKLVGKYPDEDKEIYKWFSLAIRQFPIYLKHWRNHPTQKKRQPILEEVSFKIPYYLPSESRPIYLIGIFDALYLFAEEWIKLQENKSKGKIDETGISSTLKKNLQTMIYHSALRRCIPRGETTAINFKYFDFLHNNDAPISLLLPISNNGKRITKVYGTLYNVIRRPQADQRSLKQRKGRGKARVGRETDTAFFDRIAKHIQENEETFFYRWEARIKNKDVQLFERETLIPILCQLVAWWKWISNDDFQDPWRIPDTDEVMSGIGLPNTPGGGHHFQSPWGCYNSLASGWRGSYFDYLTKGVTVGLYNVGDNH